MTDLESPPSCPATGSLRRRLGQGLVSHFFIYCLAVCLFSMVNVVLGGSAWFQWPALIWGVLLVIHVVAVATGEWRHPSLD